MMLVERSVSSPPSKTGAPLKHEVWVGEEHRVAGFPPSKTGAPLKPYFSRPMASIQRSSPPSKTGAPLKRVQLTLRSCDFASRSPPSKTGAPLKHETGEGRPDLGLAFPPVEDGGPIEAHISMASSISVGRVPPRRRRGPH